MGKLGIVFLCVAAGIVSKRQRLFPEHAASVLNRFVILISLPALTLFHIHRLGANGINTGLSPWIPGLLIWLVLIASIAVFAVLGRILRLDRPTIGALTLTAGLGNTSFVGFALLESLYGPRALSMAVLADQLGSFMAMGTLGIAVASFYVGQEVSVRQLVRRVVSFPPFLALVLAFALRPIPFPLALDETLERLGSTLVPLALTAVGMELRISLESLKRERMLLALGLGFKLLIAPALILAVGRGLMGLHGFEFNVIVLEAAMAPMVTAGIIAAEYELRAELASLMIGVGIPLSLISVPLWSRLLEEIR